MFLGKHLDRKYARQRISILTKEKTMNIATCPKCGTVFEHVGEVERDHPGFLCPECRRLGYMLLGVLHFQPTYPEITTA